MSIIAQPARRVEPMARGRGGLGIVRQAFPLAWTPVEYIEVLRVGWEALDQRGGIVAA
jgi:hypothetical protein